MKLSWPRIVAVGLASGFLAGLLGIGGGVLKVPGLVLFVGMDQYIAAGTSVATNVASGTAAVITFGANGSVDWWTAFLVFLGAAGGAWVGSHNLQRIPEHLLAAVFSVVMIIAAVRMFI